MKRRILLTGGGTGGSVTPLLAIAEHLQRRDPDLEFLFIGSATGPEVSLCATAGIPFQSIPAGKLRRYWSWKNITDLGHLWSAWRRARQIVRRWPPDVVVAAGSFVAVPVVWAARQTGSRVLIHQQDIQPGLANRLMAPAADVITVAFEASLRDFSQAKVRLIGNPVRSEILHGALAEAKKIFQLKPDVPVLLVVGGGTGAQVLNRIMTATAFRVIQHWQVIHITGQGKDLPHLHDEQYHQYPFLTWQYAHALAAADLVLTRCGLGAITDLAATGKPAIFVPMPGTHQIENAQIISDVGAGVVVPQRDMTEERLMSLLDQFRQDPSLSRQWSTNIRRLYHPEALTKIADLILHLADQ